MKNLYDILEVSSKASKEVIDKAYRVLAKKYHPDLQNEDNKKFAETKMKEINEAYEILSDDEKRSQYDSQLEAQRQQEEYEREQSKQENMKQVQNTNYNEVYKVQNENQNYNNQNIYQEQNVNSQKENMKILQNEMKRAYANAYNDYLRSLGYKIKEPWTLKRFINLIEAICILAIIIAILWFFPPTHKLIIDFYENNSILRAIVNLIGNIIIGLWNGFITFLNNAFNSK